MFNNIHWYVTTGGRKYRDRSYLHEEKVPLYKGEDLVIGLAGVVKDVLDDIKMNLNIVFGNF